MGAKVTHQQLESGRVKTWDHFQCDIPNKHYSKERATELSKLNSRLGVYKRGLEEIADSSIETVLDLIASNSIYRGEEFEKSIKEFKKFKVKYSKAENKNIFTWSTFLTNKSATIKNTVVGTLLMDISEGVDIESAVGSYEAKVAPQNYKRTSSVITKRMVDDAMKTIDKLGIREALPREYAKISDVSVNNVLFVDRSIESKMKDSIADLLEPEVKSKAIKVKNTEDIAVDDFIDNILPKTSSMKVLVENKHNPNFMSLIAPKDKDAEPILQWDNNFSWSYNGDVTDSIKERVKNAGGDVTGVIRVSLAWFNTDDLDLHIIEPDGNRISFNRKHSRRTSGQLDVDMNVSNCVRNAVENITWPDRNKIMMGGYKIIVNNYTKRESIDVGFEIELECNGQLFTFNYNKPVRSGANKSVSSFNFDGTNIEVTDVNKDIETSGKSKDVWGVTTENFVAVDTLMYSPNHWDDNNTGNKHYVFALKDCKNPDSTRGLYNEFLRSDLTKHRKVFEVLGSKMKCEHSDAQLSGLGFSSTKRNNVICVVEGKVNKTYNVLF